MKRIARWTTALILVAALVVTILVEREATPQQAEAGGLGPDKALVLYHPSRDAGFADSLASAVTDVLITEGFKVDVALTTRGAPEPGDYVMVVIISNTYWWAPDWPTQRYLDSRQFRGRAVIGLMAGAGATGRAERILEERLKAAGAMVYDVRSLWTWRPNDEANRDVPNRQVAMTIARDMVREFALAVLTGNVVPKREPKDTLPP